MRKKDSFILYCSYIFQHFDKASFRQGVPEKDEVHNFSQQDFFVTKKIKIYLRLVRKSPQ